MCLPLIEFDSQMGRSTPRDLEISKFYSNWRPAMQSIEKEWGTVL
uniref:Uncharacterized protein n=1 Tax=Arundo donax TaxID=35708 RepID=A0A0A8ZXD9_ARUDO